MTHTTAFFEVVKWRCLELVLAQDVAMNLAAEVLMSDRDYMAGRSDAIGYGESRTMR